VWQQVCRFYSPHRTAGVHVDTDNPARRFQKLLKHITTPLIISSKAIKTNADR
jgi:hypothetical protein